MDKRLKKNNKERVLHRIKIIQGHLKSIERMIEEDKYCVDVIHQSLAVQRALHKINLLLMENHLNTCVLHQIRTGQEKQTTKELLKLFEFKN